MIAVVDIAGQQFKVVENQKYYVPLLDVEAEKEITLDKVLLYADENGTKVGTPYVDALTVTAKVLAHVQDDKILLFKKKRRTGYEKRGGHRQQLTHIEIMKIG